MLKGRKQKLLIGTRIAADTQIRNQLFKNGRRAGSQFANTEQTDTRVTHT